MMGQMFVMTNKRYQLYTCWGFLYFRFHVQDDSEKALGKSPQTERA